MIYTTRELTDIWRDVERDVIIITGNTLLRTIVNDISFRQLHDISEKQW